MTGIAIRSGFEALVLGVVAYFTAAGVTAQVLTGYRERPKQENQGPGGANRVIFLPGSLNGGAGRLAVGPRDVGRQVITDPNADDAPVALIRPLVSWQRSFTISIWAADRTKIRDELAQIVAVEDLFEQVVRAVEQIKGAGGPNVGWGAVSWTVAKENTYGAELLVEAGLVHPLFDGVEELAFPGFTLDRDDDDEDDPD